MNFNKLSTTVVVSVKSIVLVAVSFLLLLFLTYKYSHHPIRESTDNKQLYLLDQAKKFVYNTDVFASKVQEVSRQLAIPAAWLMSVFTQ